MGGGGGGSERERQASSGIPVDLCSTGRDAARRRQKTLKSVQGRQSSVPQFTWAPEADTAGRRLHRNKWLLCDVRTAIAVHEVLFA